MQSGDIDEEEMEDLDSIQLGQVRLDISLISQLSVAKLILIQVYPWNLSITTRHNLSQQSQIYQGPISDIPA